MIDSISKEIKRVLSTYSEEDNIIFNNKIININKDNFSAINALNANTSIAFIDGGQAEIISAGNFCLSFIRIGGVVFNKKKVSHVIKEFYLLTTATYQNDDLIYISKVFNLDNGSEDIVQEEDLVISSTDASIKNGIERAPISKVANMARRFAELSLAASIESDFVILDGTLEKTYHQEEKYLEKLTNVCGLAKSSSLFTTSGNSPVVLLNKIGPAGCWRYFVEDKTSFVKLNQNSKHVFRFEGSKEVLSSLLDNCTDALFLGYPYGLILADKLARVSNAEKNSLRMRFLLNDDNKEIAEYLSSSDAHSILDNLG